MKISDGIKLGWGLALSVIIPVAVVMGAKTLLAKWQEYQEEKAIG